MVSRGHFTVPSSRARQVTSLWRTHKTLPLVRLIKPLQRLRKSSSHTMAYWTSIVLSCRRMARSRSPPVTDPWRENFSIDWRTFLPETSRARHASASSAPQMVMWRRARMRSPLAGERFWSGSMVDGRRPFGRPLTLAMSATHSSSLTFRPG